MSDDIGEDLDFLKLAAGVGFIGAVAEAKKRRQAEVRQQVALGDIKSELRKLRQIEEGKEKLPQCPACGGRLEGAFRKCSHCSMDLSWVKGRPCEVGQEAKLEAKIREEEWEAQQRPVREAEEKRRQERAKQDAHKKWLAARHPCRTCNRPTLGQELADVRSRGLSDKLVCGVCADEIGSRNLRKFLLLKAPLVALLVGGVSYFIWAGYRMFSSDTSDTDLWLGMTCIFGFLWILMVLPFLGLLAGKQITPPPLPYEQPASAST